MTTTHTKPESFRLPTIGPDPYFGFTRSFYYLKDKDGTIPLIRIRERGKRRGVTLVPYDRVAAFIRAQAEAGKEAVS